MIIDIHAHACGENSTTEGILKNLTANNADKIVLVPGQLGSHKTYRLPNIASWFPNREVVKLTNMMTKIVIRLTGEMKKVITLGNESVFQMHQAYPNTIYQFYWISLTLTQDIIQQLETDYARYHFRGVKVHQCWETFSFKAPAFQSILRWCVDKNLPLFIHADSHDEIQHLIALLEKEPRAKVILGHLIGLEQFIKRKKPFPNVYFDISPPSLTSIERIKKAIMSCKADHVLLGSDTPYGQDNLAINITRIQGLSISQKEKDFILGGTAAHVLQIDEKSSL